MRDGKENRTTTPIRTSSAIAQQRTTTTTPGGGLAATTTPNREPFGAPTTTMESLKRNNTGVAVGGGGSRFASNEVHENASSALTQNATQAAAAATTAISGARGQGAGGGGGGGNPNNNNNNNNNNPGNPQQQQQQQTQKAKSKSSSRKVPIPPPDIKEEPTCCDKVMLCFSECSFVIRGHWRRIMAVPAAFVLWNYILPFALEVSILAIHFQELSDLPEGVPFTDWAHFPRLRSFVVADCIIGTLLGFRFFVGLLVNMRSSIFRFLISPYGVVSLLTLPMMMYPAFADGAAAFNSQVTAESLEILNSNISIHKMEPEAIAMIPDGVLLFSVPSVAAWRIWIVYDIVQTIIFASSNVSKSFRAIVFQLSFILTLFFTTMSTMQLIFCVERGSYIDLGTSFYFTAVTLTTVGYGDYAPTSILGRSFLITQIFAAMLAVPLLLAETDRLLRFLMSLTGYAGSDRHIIIFGELTQTEFDQILNDRFSGDGSDDPLHLVFVASSFEPELADRVQSDAHISNFVTLCVANQLSRSELIRFSPHRADAALFYSSSKTAAMRGDYRIIAAAASVRLHHPSLPQYLMMRRTDTAHLVEGAFVVFDRDFLRAALLGTSLQIPGFLPMFLNLIRLVPDKVVCTASSSSSSAALKRKKKAGNDDGDAGSGGSGGGSDDDGSGAEDEEGGREMKTLRHVMMRHLARGGGGSPSSSSAAFQLQQEYLRRRARKEKEKSKKNPPPPSWYEMYLAGAKQNIYTIAVPDVLVGRTFVVASFIVQLRTGAIPIGVVRDSRVALNAGTTPITSTDSLVVIAKSWEDLYVKFKSFPTTSSVQETLHTNVTKVALRSKEVHFEVENHASANALFLSSRHNCFPFQKHVILVDLASFVSMPEMCAEESFQMEQFQVQDMLALASRFPKWQSFVLLSLSPITEVLQVEWAKSGRQPIFHVRRSPLDPDALKLCRIGSCMSVLIFSSLSATNASDDAFRSAMFTVNRRVQSALQMESSNHNRNNNNNAMNSTSSGGAGGGGGWSQPNVIAVLGAPEEALLLAPEHKSLGDETLEHDAHCTSFATGGGLCPTLLDGLMFRTYYNEYLPQVVELLLEPSAIHRDRADQLAPALFEDMGLFDNTAASSSGGQQQQGDNTTGSGNSGGGGGGSQHNSSSNLKNSSGGGGDSPSSLNASAAMGGVGDDSHNSDVKLPTFGQICRVMTAGKVICFGFSRVITTPERGVDTVGKVFFVTNPDLSTPVHADDYVFYLPQWTQERLARDFFA